MTETSPIGTINTPLSKHDALPAQEQQSSAPVRGGPFSASNCRWWTWMANRCPGMVKAGVSAGQRALGGRAILWSGRERPDAAGWFDTGDIGTLDANGYLVISDRAKDIIKSGGEWISTVELENIAIAHPGCAARRPSPPAIRAGTSGRCCCASVRKGAKWRRPIC